MITHKYVRTKLIFLFYLRNDNKQTYDIIKLSSKFNNLFWYFTANSGMDISQCCRMDGRIEFVSIFGRIPLQGYQGI